MLRLPHCLDSWFTDDDEIVSFTLHQEDSWFLWRLNRPQGLVRLEELGKLKHSIDFIGNGTRDLPACSIVPQPTTLRLESDQQYEVRISDCLTNEVTS
jgi:hypothetical protein